MRNLGKSIALVFLLVLAQFIFGTLAFAQGGRGSIVGSVRDQANSPLASALVEVHSTGQRAATDDQGQYRITELPSGDYTVTFSYVGFAPSTKTVTVVAGQTAALDASLNVASQTDQVIVTAERVQGEAEAINIDPMSAEILPALPLIIIHSFPNTNIPTPVAPFP